MGVFEKALATFASLSDAELGRELGAPQRPSPRFLLYESLRDEQQALVSAHQEWRPSESERALLLAQEAFGDLQGLLVGRSNELLDRTPARGEWTLRQVLRHVLATEMRYAAQILYSAHRGEDEPVGIPPERLPCDRETPPDPRDTATRSGAVERILDAIATARAETDALAGGLPPEALARPSLWGTREVHVRRRLHQVAAHLVEHTIQCQKTLSALGVADGDARHVVRRIAATRAAHEAISDDTTLRELDAAHGERVALISRERSAAHP